MAFDATTGSATANSYGTVAEWLAYCADRQIVFPEGSNAQWQAWLIRGTEYIDATYKFQGLPTSSTQALCWPRGGAYDRNGNPIASDVIPAVVKAATFEMALLASAGTLVENVTADDRVIRAKAGSVEVEYASGAKEAGTRYTWVDRLLSDVTTGGSGGMIRQTTRGW